MSKAAHSNGSGIPVYDPRGVVEAEAVTLAPRRDKLDGLRLAVLDNTKWNARKLLHKTVELMGAQVAFAGVRHYAKESFSLSATPELVARIVAENDLVLTAIGD